ncbi:hypothetical protein QEZ40_004670 [Streptomyces katrae]|uniref:Uncharacterized protein n=1 Tax=Streptomyces katrae TaxID=68223 RepID=A0ABT7H040_9ACTN|nr:hypothetical protein [Streptomyces katrae]MDK9499253.1 hypothetical protein [Streptomyces katrae]
MVLARRADASDPLVDAVAAALADAHAPAEAPCGFHHAVAVGQSA